MKRTTYIIFGMLLAGLVVVIGGAFYFAMNTSEWGDIPMSVKGEKKTVELPDCKVVQLVAERDIFIGTDGRNEIRMLDFNNAPLKVRQAQSGANTFTYASDMDKYMTLKTMGDTLRIVFKFSEDKLDEKYQKMLWLNVDTEEMAMDLSDDVQFIANVLGNQKMSVEGFNRDSLSIAMKGYATITDCNFKALTVSNGAWLFNTGKADNLHLHLDGIRSWEVNGSSFQVDTEYLYAFNRQNCTLEKGEARQVIWKPQLKNASLNIELKEAARVVLE